MGVRIAVAQGRPPASQDDRATSADGGGFVARSMRRAPLVVRLVATNALVLLAALIAWSTIGGTAGAGGPLVILGAALLLALVLDVALVAHALRPLQWLERTADRVCSGDLEARVPVDAMADPRMAHLGAVANALLDRMQHDREQMRRLAAQVIGAQDEERARIAGELHDSIAQSLAALTLHVSSAASAAGDPDLERQLALVRKIIGDVLDEVRALSGAMHPRVLDDLGLPAALDHLARQVRERTDVAIVVDAGAPRAELPSAVRATLYRIAQEAIGNAIRHAGASMVRVRLEGEGDRLRLAVEDDGSGFDVARAIAERGTGLFAMRERVALVDGALHIDATPGRGTRIVASVPLTR